jgi:hypothetical protein
VSDLPPGWTSAPVDNSKDSGSFCNVADEVESTASSHAEADFENGNVPYFDEAIAGYQNAPDGLITKAINELSQCTSFTSGGSTFTLGRISFPSFGTQSAAFQAKGTAPGPAVAGDFLLIQKARQVVFLVYADLGTPDVTQLQTFAHQVMAKIPTE